MPLIAAAPVTVGATHSHAISRFCRGRAVAHQLVVEAGCPVPDTPSPGMDGCPPRAKPLYRGQRSHGFFRTMSRFAQALPKPQVLPAATMASQISTRA